MVPSKRPCQSEVYMKCRKFLHVTGMAIGLFLAGSVPNVKAQDAGKIEEVHPTMTVGSLASNTVIAHRVAADQIIINGYDMGRLLEGLLNAMGSNPTGSLTREQLQQILAQSRPDKALK